MLNEGTLAKRMREQGQICCLCRIPLAPPHPMAERFCVKCGTPHRIYLHAHNYGNLWFVQFRRAQASRQNLQSFYKPEPVFDGGELLERIETVQRECLKQSDDDIDVLKAYLKTQRAPKEAIEALGGLTVEQHKAWKIAVGKIKKVIGE
jgi:hypothetical protein